MRKDSKIFLRKLLEYRKKVERDSFEINYQYFKEIPSIESAVFDILEDLVNCNCLTAQSKVIDLAGDISVNLTFDGITYFNEGELKKVSKENNSQYILNIQNGQINIANDNGIINVAQNNSSNTQQKVKSRTQEYADKWNANMFLNDFNKRDENAGVNVKLSEVYVDEHLPHYIWKCNFKPFNDLKIFLAERIYGDNYYNQMLLVLGQPGIGKSTLITWVIANFSSKIDSILVYQFASDLKKVRWENISSSHSILSDIFKVLGILHEELDNKTIILDGFDELSVTNDRAEILNQLNWELKKDYAFINFSLIILCRENYIHKLDKVECDYITLQPWEHKQIRSFCNVFYKKTINSVSENTVNKMLEKKKFLGFLLFYI